VRVTLKRGNRILISSAAVFTHRNPCRVSGHGCWMPPDTVAIDSRGSIRLLGRRGTTVKIGARRVNLAEVSARLRRLTGVRDVWVAVGGPGEQTLGAALVSARSIPELRADLQADAASWKIPKKWITVAELPLTERGKVDTRALRARVFGE
jgi:acyl-coenzyme A synthetase/AMP-(fatty) acid ligase